MRMRPRFLVLVGILALQLASCEKGGELRDALSFAKADRPWAHEEHWMVAGTVRDLQGMLKLSGRPSAEDSVIPTQTEHEFRVGEITLQMAPSCWDTASYRPFLNPWKIESELVEDSPSDLLKVLLKPTAKTLQQVNEHVSGRIKASPASAVVHEEAAFLLGVFGLRENARQFGDLRPLLCRMTAHLAFAEHLREGGQATRVGQWAEVFHDCHAGRPLRARERMQSIGVDGDSGRWKRVIDLLITKDWRQTADSEDLSLAEAIVHARALQVHWGNSKMMAFVTERKDLQGIPDWSRMLAGPGKSIEDGHLAMQSCIGMEIHEMGAIFKIGENPDPSEIASHLAKDGAAALVAEGGEPKVISDADWAAYFRRHLFKSCADISHFALSLWSSHEAAVEWEESLMPYCRKLPDCELLEPLVSTSAKDYHKDLKVTADYIRKHPERVPMGLWYNYQFPTLEVEVQTSMPAQADWFREVSPPGTAHDPTMRYRYSGIANDWVTNMKKLHRIDPWNTEICYEVAESQGHSLDAVKEAWGEIFQYSKRPHKQSLQGAGLTVPERIEILRMLVKYDPNMGLELASQLVMADRPEEAILAYEEAYEKSDDRVSVSNRSKWMIYHYVSKGEGAKAREIADHHAKVYSHSGLNAAMSLAIYEKDLKRARDLAEATAERYGSYVERDLVAWFLDGDEKALRRIFPGGLREVSVADLSAEKNASGCQVINSSSTLFAVGMRQGDVVVAVDGKRVENFSQYNFLMRGELDPRVRLIYRRGKQYQEVECRLPDRLLRVEMRDVGR
jgi:hypothetical protein